MSRRERRGVERAARVLVGREVHWTVVVLALCVLATFLPVPALQVPGYLLLIGFDAPQNALLPGLGGVAYWAGFAGYLYVVSVLVGGVVRVLADRFLRREPSVTPQRRAKRSRLPSKGVVVSTAKTLAGPEVVGVFVLVAGLAYATMQNVPVLRVPGRLVLAVLDWAILGTPGSPLSLASTLVAAYVVALGVGNVVYLLRRWD